MAIGLILSSFFKALGQLGDRRFRRVLWLGIVLTIALLFAAYFGLLWIIELMFGSEAYFDLFGRRVEISDLLGVTSFLLMLVLSVFLMVPVASAITSMFLDDVAQAVEDRHYPHLPHVPRWPFSEAVRDTLSFMGLLIVANLLAFFIYLLILPAGPFIFWGMNGFLLGREYFMLVAMRRHGREAARVMRRQHIATIWAAGALMAVPLSIPLVNLVIPILGAATFTHLFHGLLPGAGSPGNPDREP